MLLKNIDSSIFRARAAAWMMRRNFWFRLASEAGSAERMSKSIHTSRGIAFTEVPPPVTLAEYVTLGSDVTLIAYRSVTALLIAAIGLTMPNAP